MAELYTYSEEETIDYARRLAEGLCAGSFISLSGDLGAGKTAFTKGIALGLGISETIVSPTFTILRMYETGRLPLYHFDVYRIGMDDLAETDFYEFAFGNGVCVCEWAELIESELPEVRVDVKIERAGDDARRIIVENIGA